jgi:hypothetical protein
MNMQDLLKAVIPILVACIAWLLGQVSSFQERLTKIEGKMPALDYKRRRTHRQPYFSRKTPYAKG